MIGVLQAIGEPDVAATSERSHRRQGQDRG
jgi:hypothetical protein